MSGQGSSSPIDTESRDSPPPEGGYYDVSVVGLGRVGISVATGLAAAGHDVTGYDVDPDRIATLVEEGPAAPDAPVSPRDDPDSPDPGDLEYTTDPRAMRSSEFVFVAVPTPVNESGSPDLSAVTAAGETVGRHLCSGTTVVMTSTMYPGGTEEVLLPALEAASGSSAGSAFSVAYSPERLVPGDPRHGMRDVTRVVAAREPAVTEELATLYETFVEADVYRAPSIRVAEAAKCIENVQRDVNVALVNELSMAFDRMGIDSHAVFETARTKWNFLDFRPGLVGGRCIPVDPNYLVHGASSYGATLELTRTARRTNESVPDYVISETLDALRSRESGDDLYDARVLVLGLAYKPEVGEFRSSPIGSVVDGLEASDVHVAGYDPHVDDEAASEFFEVNVLSDLTFQGFDGVLLATGHAAFGSLDVERVCTELNDSPVVVDLAGVVDRADVADTDAIYRGL